MNKLSSLVLGILLISYAARSQSHFGLKGGLNLANQVKTMSLPQTPTLTENSKPFLGYQFGMFYKTKTRNHFFISAETNFSVIGSSMSMMSPDGKRYDTHEKLGYIELPVTFHYSLNKFYFGMGPSVGYRLFSKLKNFENRTFDLTHYRSMDIAGNLSAGYPLSCKFDMNLRYSRGLMNIYKDPGYANTKNSFINLSVLYTLQ